MKRLLPLVLLATTTVAIAAPFGTAHAGQDVCLSQLASVQLGIETGSGSGTYTGADFEFDYTYSTNGVTFTATAEMTSGSHLLSGVLLEINDGDGGSYEVNEPVASASSLNVTLDAELPLSTSSYETLSFVVGECNLNLTTTVPVIEPVGTEPVVGGGGGGTLPSTGNDSSGTLLAVTLLLAGAGFVLLARRRPIV